MLLLLFIPYFNNMKFNKTLKDITIICVIAIVICLYFIFIKQKQGVFPKLFLIASICIFLLSIFFESFAELFLQGWLRLGMFLGKLNRFVILSILFFLFLLPFSYLKKIFSKDQLFLNFKLNKSSFFNRRHFYNSSDFEKIW